MKRVTFKMFACVLVVLTLTVFTFGQVAGVQNQQHGHVKQALDDYFTQQHEAGILNGMVLIAKEGEIFLKKGYGMADYETGTSNNPSTVFNIGSMSKAFASMSIMMLEERGLLNVDDTIDQYIPGFPNGDLITIHQCLTHTSGLYRYVKSPDSELWQNSNWAQFHTTGQLMQHFMYQPLQFEPGSNHLYCNSGYVVLGVIIENVSGMSFRDFIKINILDPLNMKSTSYDPYEVDFQNKVATGYDSILEQPAEAMYLHPTVAFSAGGIFSNINDIYKWDQVLYTEQLVSTQTLEKMFTPGPGNYGYAWRITQLEYKGLMHKQIWHAGSYPGYHSLICRFVDENITVIILANISNSDPSTQAKLMVDDAFYMIWDAR